MKHSGWQLVENQAGKVVWAQISEAEWHYHTAGRVKVDARLEHQVSPATFLFTYLGHPSDQQMTVYITEYGYFCKPVWFYQWFSKAPLAASLPPGELGENEFSSYALDLLN